MAWSLQVACPTVHFHFHLDKVHSVIFDLWTLITQNYAFKEAYIRKDQQISSLPMLSFIRRLMFLEEIYLFLRYGNTFMIPLSNTSDTRHGKSVFPKCVYLRPHFWGDNGSKWVVRAKEIMPQLRVLFFPTEVPGFKSQHPHVKLQPSAIPGPRVLMPLTSSGVRQLHGT